MSRSQLAWFLGFIAMCALVANVPKAKSFTPTAYAPLPTSAFLPVDPLVRPIHSAAPGSGADDSPSSSGSHPLQSASTSSATPSTSRPTGGLLPPIVAAKGTAGVATWYSYHAGQAAAAQRLRDALGGSWRGQVVLVCHAGACLRIRLTDYESSQVPGRLIDLDGSDFRRLCGPLSMGVCAVTVTGS